MILGMVAVTWGVRAAPFVISDLKLSPALLRVLNCIPAAVLAALVSEPILSPVVENQSIIQAEVIAAAVCVLLGAFRAPMLLTVVFGMTSYWALKTFFL
jgi:branched-subunit amino acid transport protein